MHEIAVHAGAVPRVAKLPGAGDRKLYAVRPEKCCRQARRMADAGVEHAVAAGLAQVAAEILTVGPILRVQARAGFHRCQVSVHGTGEFAEIRFGRGLGGGAHEALEMIGGFGERHLRPVAAIPDAVTAVGKAAGPVPRGMGKNGHDQGGTGSADPAVQRDQGKVADHIAHPGIELGGGREQQLPVGGVGNVIEQVDRRVDRADDAVGDRPAHHQLAARSASR